MTLGQINLWRYDVTRALAECRAARRPMTLINRRTPMRYPRLTIVHNHGTLTLSHAVVGPDGVARGTVIEGHEVSRLFFPKATCHETPGTVGSWPLYGREPINSYLGWTDNGEWRESPIQGSYVVDCTFCG